MVHVQQKEEPDHSCMFNWREYLNVTKVDERRRRRG